MSLTSLIKPNGDALTTNESPQIHAFQEALIVGNAARAFRLVNDPAARARVESRGVRSLDDAMIALANRNGGLHVCPLCRESFDIDSLVAHADQCIQARHPRRRFWTPAGFSKNAIAAFKEKVKMT